MEIEVIKAFEIKQKNKRFTIVWYSNNCVVFQTRTLQDWKKRIITTTSGQYSMESFLTLKTLFSTLCNDYDFAKMANPTIGKLNKEKISVQAFSNEPNNEKETNNT